MNEDPRRAIATALASADPARIALHLDRLGRLELTRFLADVAVIATENGLGDARRRRLLRQQYEADHPVGDNVQRAPDGSIIRGGVSGWNR